MQTTASFPTISALCFHRTRRIKQASGYLLVILGIINYKDALSLAELKLQAAETACMQPALSSFLDYQLMAWLIYPGTE